jgi:hypothetical protein
VVVGENAGRGDIRKQAYRWTASGRTKLLWKFPRGGPFSVASGLGLTDDGNEIVGFSGGARRDAFIWTRIAGMIELKPYLESPGVTGMHGWRLDTAIAISGDGSTICGWGYRPDGRVQSWIVRNLPRLGSSARPGDDPRHMIRRLGRR